MIFATVGTQLPFPRLISALDRIAGRHSLRIFAQTCDVRCACSHMECAPQLHPGRFEELAREASLIIGHAGIGTVLTAKKLGKPLVIFPRRASLGEHRNEHQLATARALERMKGIHVAWDEPALETLATAPGLEAATMDDEARRAPLVDCLRQFIEAESS